MLNRKMKNELKKMHFHDKLLGAAIILIAASVIFPWYQQSDAWGGKAEVYFGINGPLYLIGWIILVIAGAALFVFFQTVFRKKEISWLIDKNLLYILTGAFTLFFNILAYSIYFHNKFGINPLRKEIRFGMLLSFLGASLAIIAGYLKYKQEKAAATPYMYEAQSPSEKQRLINIEEKMREPRPQTGISSRMAATSEESNPASVVRREPEKEVVNLKMNL